jgi:nitrite reductase (NADH) large subunit
MVKITGGQRIDLVGVRKEQLPEMWRELGMPSGHAYTKSFRTCKTCLGSEYCRYGVGDSTTLGVQIERRYQGLETPAKLKLATAGCPRNCSEATTKDVGAVAIEGGKWEVYVGGAAGAHVRKGDVLVVVDSHEAVLKYAGRFMQYYREHAKYLERTYDFVPRIGIETLRGILVDDAQGICARLDAEMDAAVGAYVDPWQEATTPVHPSQFADALEPVGAGSGSGPPCRCRSSASRTTISARSTASRRARGRPFSSTVARSRCSAHATTTCGRRRRAARTRRGCSRTASSVTDR